MTPRKRSFSLVVAWTMGFAYSVFFYDSSRSTMLQGCIGQLTTFSVQFNYDVASYDS